MKWKEKWKKMNMEQALKDIERCRQHPTKWKILTWVFAIGFSAIAVFMVVGGAYPLAVIAIVFGVWMEREYIKVYRKAFPKIDQAIEGLK